nr:MAG TPA: hypothetical protein [Myoviridae sp. ctfuG5]
MLQPFTVADVTSAIFYSFWGYMFLTLVKATFLSEIMEDKEYRLTRYFVIFVQNILLISTMTLIIMWCYSDFFVKLGVILP